MLYSARDMAVLRASLNGSAQAVLASATPSLESWVNAEAGQVRGGSTCRVAVRGGARCRTCGAIDMRAESLPHRTAGSRRHLAQAR